MIKKIEAFKECEISDLLMKTITMRGCDPREMTVANSRNFSHKLAQFLSLANCKIVPLFGGGLYPGRNATTHNGY